MKIVVVVDEAESKTLNEIGDAIWAAQKDNAALSFDAREALKALSTSIHAEAARLRKAGK